MSDLFPAELALLLRVLLALVAVLALAVVSLRWLLPRWQGRRLPGRPFAGRPARRLQVLEVQAIDRDHRLALLRVARPRGEREVLIALGAGGSSYLDSWSVDPRPQPLSRPEEVRPRPPADKLEAAS